MLEQPVDIQKIQATESRGKLMNYEERQQARLERYQELAQKAKHQSKESYEASNRAVAGIVPGQPILVGHHSEKAHRNAIKRSWTAMDKSIELTKKAEHYEAKVDGILNSNIISSDDENAITKLQDKLKGLEEKREQIKEHNKAARKEGKDQHPSYILSNLGQNIKSVKARIERLKNIQVIPDEDININGIRIEVDKESNRVKIFFPDKPEEELRSSLKQNGFRWSPYNGCWQRQISEYAIKLAKDFAIQYNGKEEETSLFVAIQNNDQNKIDEISKKAAARIKQDQDKMQLEDTDEVRK